MNLAAFVGKHNGRYVDYDKAYGPQCVDLIKQWQAENKQPVQRGNARDWAGARPGYRWVPNGPFNKPNPGDIVVFTGGGGYGHIGICMSADKINLTCFEQCYPKSTLTNSRGQVTSLGSPCAVVFHRLYGIGTATVVRGWLQKI